MGARWNARFFEESPHHWPIASVASRFSGYSDFPPVEVWDEVLGKDLPVRFTLQPPVPRRRPRSVTQPRYNTVIHLESRVPSRSGNWHDFLNALVWSVFPASKRALHARQHHAGSARIPEGATRLPTHRSREMDTLSLLDEGGVIVLSEAELPDSRAVDRALDEGRAVAIVFGHAIFEGLLRDGNGFACTARVAVLKVETVPSDPAGRLELADRGLAARLEDPHDLLDPSILPRTSIRGGSQLHPASPRSA